MSLIQTLTGNPAVRSVVNNSFHAWAGWRIGSLNRTNAVEAQKLLLKKLIKKAAKTRFGQDHQFNSIRSAADFQSAVPIRTYEKFWDEYLKNVFIEELSKISKRFYEETL